MKPWQILYRQNKSAIETGVVTRNIPSYAAPSLRSFYLHHVANEEPTSLDGPDALFLGGHLFFYLEFNNFDALDITNVTMSPEESWSLDNPFSEAVLEAPDTAMTRFGNGFLWEVIAGFALMSNNPATPALTFTYQDPSGATHEVGPASISNGPITVYQWIAVPDPAVAWIGDEIEVAVLPKTYPGGVSVPSLAAYVTEVNVTDWGDV